MLKVEIFSERYQSEWNHFVKSSKNGTFLFYRDFMDYHADRFRDHSLLFYKKDQLIALLPGNIEGTTYYSHQGLTYGGLILSADIRSKDVLDIFDWLAVNLPKEGIEELVYKPVPHIYHTLSAEEDLYALFRNGADLIGRNISSTICLDNLIPFSQQRKRGMQRAQRAGISIIKDNKFSDFWTILETNLKQRYSTTPVHSLAEIESLYSRFTNNISLYSAYNQQGVMVGGVVVFETKTVVHLQYIAANEYGKEYGALDLIVDYILKNGSVGKRYLDFGTSTEKNGIYLNEGLIQQKEGFGGRGVVYDIYRIKLN